MAARKEKKLNDWHSFWYATGNKMILFGFGFFIFGFVFMNWNLWPPTISGESKAFWIFLYALGSMGVSWFLGVVLTNTKSSKQGYNIWHEIFRK